MEFRKYARFLMVPLLVFVFVSFESRMSLGATKKMLTWGTTSTTSGTFTYFPAAAKFLNDKIPEINVTVRSTGGSVHNVRLIENREIDIGAIDTNVAWNAVQGKGPFEGKPFQDAALRLLYVLQVNALQFVVSEKSGVKTIYDLEGKLYTPGGQGSSTEQVVMDIFRILGVHPKFRRSDYPDAVEAMKDGRIVGFGKLGAPDSMVLDVASVMKIGILSFTEAELEKIMKNVPGFRRIIVPAGTYAGIGEVKTIANEWSDFVRKDFPADLAYKILKTIWENKTEIRQASPTFVGDQLIKVSLGVNVGFLHPGAVRFYREMGFTVPKILIPPEMEGK
jgi:uncharacterized protein